MLSFKALYNGDEAERAEADHARRLHEVIQRERINREARRLLDAEERGTPTIPEILSLREQLARPDRGVEWRIEGWQPIGGRVVLAARAKDGKTTIAYGLARSLVDGDSWLGRHKVYPIPGCVVIIDTEMPPGQLQRWLREQRIAAEDRVMVISLRGKAASFNLLDPETRSRWAQTLRARQVSYLILDCLRPVLDAIGLDEHRDIGRFLVAFDALLHEAGIGEALVVHHMGHSGERSRGDSRVRDWPDAEWRLVRRGDDPASSRYISAFGRDVDIPECLLAYDPNTRRLMIADGSRRDAIVRAALDAVIAALSRASSPLTLGGLEAAGARSSLPRGAIREAVAVGVRRHLIVVELGPKRAKLHRLSGESASSPDSAISSPADSSRVSAPVRRRSIGAAHSHTGRRRTEGWG